MLIVKIYSPCNSSLQVVKINKLWSFWLRFWRKIGLHTFSNYNQRNAVSNLFLLPKLLLTSIVIFFIFYRREDVSVINMPSRCAEMGAGKPRYKWNWTWWGMLKITRRDSTDTLVNISRQIEPHTPSDKCEGGTGFHRHREGWGIQQILCLSPLWQSGFPSLLSPLISR